MLNLNSCLLDIKNNIFKYTQNKLSFLSENSVLISNLDNIILFFIALTLIVSTFFPSEGIGAFAMIVAFLTIIKLFVKQGAGIKLTTWDGALIIYFLICLISVINSTLVPQSIHGFLKTIIYFAFYFSAANYFQTNKDKIKYIFILVGSLCFIESIIAILQNLSGVEQISTWQDSNYINPEDAIARAYGTLKPYNPNLLGGYLISAISCIVGSGLFALAKKHYKTFFYSLGMFLVSSFAIFVTGSRGAYLALGAMIIGLLIISSKIICIDFERIDVIKKYWKKILTGIVSAILLVLIAVPQILKRLLSIFIFRGDSSTSFRMNVYDSSWHMFCDNWLLGIGAGNQTFREIYGLYMITGFDALSTYSVPLEIAVEGGIFALLSYIAFVGLFLFCAVKFILSQKSLTEKIIISCAILTVLGVMTHGMFDTIYFRPQVQFVFWTMIAMASAVLADTSVKCDEV